MRRLMLLRHAKAEAAVPGRRDLDRPLSAEGRQDAQSLGTSMATQALRADHVLVSPARRTLETCHLVGAALESAPSARLTPDLYEATAATLLAIVRNAEPDALALLIVAHNPGLQELANKLLGSDDTEARSRIGSFPTAALAVLDFPVEAWGEVAPGAARLERFLPRTGSGQKGISA